MNLLNAFRDTVIASSEKQTNDTWMKLCAIATNKVVSISVTVLYMDNIREFWH
jgi:hypothetical protein